MGGVTISVPPASLRPPEPPADPLQQYGRLLALKGAVGQQQLQQQAITAGGQENQQRQMQLDDQKKLRQAFIDSEGDMDKFYNSATKAGVNPQTLIGVKSNLLEQKQKLATLTKDQLANYKSQTDAIGQATGSVLGLKPEERKAALLNTVIPNLAKQGVIPGDQAQALADQVNNADDNGLEEMLKLHQFSAMAADKQIDEAFKSQTRPLELRKAAADAQSAEAEAGQKMRSNAASQLAAAFKNGPDAYAAARAELPYKIASQFPDKPASPDEILQSGLSPHEAVSVPVEKLELRDWLNKNPGKSPADFMRYQKTIVPQFNFNLQAGGVGGGTGGPTASPQNPDGTPRSFEDQIRSFGPKGGVVKAIIEGRQNAPASFAQKSPYWQDVMQKVYAIDPDFNEQRAQLRKNYTVPQGNNAAQQIGAINTAMGHVGVLGDAIDALNNGNVKVLNTIANRLGLETGSTPQAVFQTIVHRVGPELSKAYIGAGGSAGERGADEKDFDPGLAPQTLKANVGITAKLLRSKIGALENNWDQNKAPSMKSFEDQFITKEAKAQLNKWSPKEQSGGGSAGGGHVIKIGDKQYQYKGSGDTSDLNNYTEIKAK